MLVIMDQTPAPTPAEPKPAQPVMDIVPPRPAELVKTPPKEETPPSSVPQQPEAKAQKPAALKTPKPPKQPRSGVGLAILATVLIILGLGALCTYAYLRTIGINPF